MAVYTVSSRLVNNVLFTQVTHGRLQVNLFCDLPPPGVSSVQAVKSHKYLSSLTALHNPALTSITGVSSYKQVYTPFAHT